MKDAFAHHWKHFSPVELVEMSSCVGSIPKDVLRASPQEEHIGVDVNLHQCSCHVRSRESPFTRRSWIFVNASCKSKWCNFCVLLFLLTLLVICTISFPKVWCLIVRHLVYHRNALGIVNVTLKVLLLLHVFGMLCPTYVPCMTSFWLCHNTR